VGLDAVVAQTVTLVDVEGSVAVVGSEGAEAVGVLVGAAPPAVKICGAVVCRPVVRGVAVGAPPEGAEVGGVLVGGVLVGAGAEVGGVVGLVVGADIVGVMVGGVLVAAFEKAGAVVLGAGGAVDLLGRGLAVLSWAAGAWDRAWDDP
jgi:hypothetical protein